MRGRSGGGGKRLNKNQELPKREVIIKSGQTLYRFTGSYNGRKSLPGKVLRLMEQENLQKEVDKMSTYNPVWQTARKRKEQTYVKAV